MNVIKKILKSFSRKDPVVTKLGKTAYKNTKRLPWSIYGSKTYGTEIKRFHWFHYVFKYKILVPILWLINWILDKKVTYKIPRGKHNHLIRLFDKVFDKSLREWTKYYLRGKKRLKNGKLVPKKWKDYLKTDSVQLLLTLKKIAVTGYLWDTAYREFANMFLYNWYLAMDKIYREKRPIVHLLYNKKNTQEVLYYAIFDKVEKYVVPVNKKEILQTYGVGKGEINANKKTKQN